MVPTRPHIDGASLIDPALHNPALMEMLQTEISRPLVQYIVDRVVDVVDYALGRPSTSTRGRPVCKSPSAHAEFSSFTTTVLERAGVHLPVILGTLVYLDRARPHLQLSLEEWACERVFLGALICANKYLNDSTLKNVHWSLCTGLFNKRDVGRIEREFLDVLDFELRITEEDILTHHDAFLSVQHARRSGAHHRIPPPPLPARAPTRRSSASSDSSMDTEDSQASSPSDSSSSMPSTPPNLPTPPDPVVIRSSSKHSPDDALPVASVPLPPPPTKETQKHSRRASALNILRNIHVPHFHSGGSQ